MKAMPWVQLALLVAILLIAVIVWWNVGKFRRDMEAAAGAIQNVLT